MFRIAAILRRRAKTASKNINKNNNKKSSRAGGKQGAQSRAITKLPTVNYGNLGNYGSQMANVLKAGYGQTLRMYRSTHNFAEVYAYPWSKEGARLPLLPIYPTKLIRSSAAGSGILNTAGIGYITVIPGNTTTNDFHSIFYSNDASSPSFLSKDVGTYTMGQATMGHVPYNAASYTYGGVNSVSYRIVALGIRVRYTGTNLNKAGEIYSAQTNPRVSMDDYGIDAIRKQQAWKTKSYASRDYFGITRMITTQFDSQFLQYAGNTDPGFWVTADGALKTQEDQNYMGLLFQGTAGQPFEWEVVTHFEVIGPNLDTQSLGSLDTPGTEQVIESLHKVRAQDNTTPDHTMSKDGSAKKNGLLDILKSGAKALIPLVASAFPGLGPLGKVINNLMN